MYLQITELNHRYVRFLFLLLCAKLKREAISFFNKVRVNNPMVHYSPRRFILSLPVSLAQMELKTNFQESGLVENVIDVSVINYPPHY